MAVRWCASVFGCPLYLADALLVILDLPTPEAADGLTADLTTDDLMTVDLAVAPTDEFTFDLPPPAEEETADLTVDAELPPTEDLTFLEELLPPLDDLLLSTFGVMVGGAWRPPFIDGKGASILVILLSLNLASCSVPFLPCFFFPLAASSSR